jgi:hypothetical protein
MSRVLLYCDDASLNRCVSAIVVHDAIQRVYIYISNLYLYLYIYFYIYIYIYIYVYVYIYDTRILRLLVIDMYRNSVLVY